MTDDGTIIELSGKKRERERQRSPFQYMMMAPPAPLKFLCALVMPLVVRPEEHFYGRGNKQQSLSNNATARQLRLCSGTHCWPGLWLVGAQKSATTSLHDVLTRQMEFCSAELVGINEGRMDYLRKETHFWFEHLIPHGVNMTDPTLRSRFVNDFTHLYPRSKVCKFGFIEATPQMHNLLAPYAMMRGMPAWVRQEIRFIAVLREPIARHMSWFVHAKIFETERKCYWPCPAGVYEKYDDFAKCWIAKFYDPLHSNDGLWPSVYARQIDAWKHVIPRKHFLILQMDTVISEWSNSIDLIARFAGVDQSYIDSHLHRVSLHLLNERSNPSSRRRRILLGTPDGSGHQHHGGAGGKKSSRLLHRKSMRCDTLALLTHVFNPWNDDLYAMLASDRATKKAPSLEPPFPPFKLNIDCVPVDHLIKRST